MEQSFKEYLAEALAVAAVNPNRGKNEVAIVVGRFSPWTLGHYKMIEAAKEEGLPVAVFLVKGKKTSDDKTKNPFPEEVQTKIITKSIDKEDLAGVYTIPTANLVEIIDILRNENKEPVLFIMGSDREDSLYSMYERYKDKIPDVKIGKKMIVRDENSNPVSGTKVRQSIIDDDFESFKTMTRNLTKKEFNLLKKFL